MQEDPYPVNTWLWTTGGLPYVVCFLLVPVLKAKTAIISMCLKIPTTGVAFHRTGQMTVMPDLTLNHTVIDGRRGVVTLVITVGIT